MANASTMAPQPSDASSPTLASITSQFRSSHSHRSKPSRAPVSNLIKEFPLAKRPTVSNTRNTALAMPHSLALATPALATSTRQAAPQIRHSPHQAHEHKQPSTRHITLAIQHSSQPIQLFAAPHSQSSPYRLATQTRPHHTRHSEPCQHNTSREIRVPLGNPLAKVTATAYPKHPLKETPRESHPEYT